MMLGQSDDALNEFPATGIAQATMNPLYRQSLPTGLVWGKRCFNAQS